MIKQDLLNALTAKFYAVGTPIAQFTEGNMARYTVSIYQKSVNDMMVRNVDFIVEDEGLSTEVAYWHPAEPSLAIMTDQFRRDVDAYIAAKIMAGTVEAAFITQMDIANEIAIAWAYALISGQWNEIKVLLNRDQNNNIQHIILDAITNSS